MPDGAAALEKLFNAKRYGLVISDWNMEPMSGFDLLKQVRANPKLETTPFIMVTAESKTENVIAAKKAGVNNYIVKPFNAQTLKAKIELIFADLSLVRTLSPPPPDKSHVKPAHDRLRRDAGGSEHCVERSQHRGLRASQCSAWMPEVTNMQSRPKVAAPVRSVRTESPIASTRLRSGTCSPRRAAAVASAVSIDRSMRLAAIQHLAAERRIGFGDGAGAIHQVIAALDDDVRIGADHEQ